MAKPKPSTVNPWVSRALYDAQAQVLSDRCADAEACVKALIALIAGDEGAFLASHAYDWKAAAHALLHP